MSRLPLPPDPPHSHVDELIARIEPWLQHMRWRADYDDWRHKRIYSEQYQTAMTAQLKAMSGPLAGRRLLDLGCGMGGFAVAAALEGAYVTALDYNSAYCAITATRGNQYDLAMPVIRAAGEALPVPNDAYDIVTAWDVIEHVQAPEQMLAEIARTLRPGGYVFVTAINRFAYRDPHYHLPLINYLPRPLAELLIELGGRSKRGAAFRDRQRLGEMHYFTFGSFCRLAATYGLRTVDLDEERIRKGQVAPQRAWRRQLARPVEHLGMIIPLYRLYRALYQGTYRLMLTKEGARGTVS